MHPIMVSEPFDKRLPKPKLFHVLLPTHLQIVHYNTKDLLQDQVFYSFTIMARMKSIALIDESRRRAKTYFRVSESLR